MADKAKDKNAVWFVRGVAPTLRAQVARAADRAGMKIGPWVEQVLRAAITDKSSAAADPMTDLARRLQVVEARLGKLEQGGAALVEDRLGPEDTLDGMKAAEPAVEEPST